MQPTIETYGDWQKVKTAITRLPEFFRSLTDELAQKIAESYYKKLQDHFIEQDLPLKPLSEWYRRWKERMGLDSRILLATHEMFETVKVYHEGFGKRFVGIKEGKIHQMAKIDVALLALVHEYGRLDRSIPARPTFRPTADELRAELDTVINTNLRELWNEVMGWSLN